MLIYRIEHRSRLSADPDVPVGVLDGPYSIAPGAHNFVVQLEDGRAGTDKHPGPHSDGIQYDETYIFGFGSPASLRRWFSLADRVVLTDEGYVGCVYTVPKSAVRIGKRQTAFKFDCAKKINTYPLTRVLRTPK